MADKTLKYVVVTPEKALLDEPADFVVVPMFDGELGVALDRLPLIGRLVQRDGDWDGVRLLSRDAVRHVTGSAGLPGDCGMGWWTNAGGRYPKLPRDAVWGAGAGGCCC